MKVPGKRSNMNTEPTRATGGSWSCRGYTRPGAAQVVERRETARVAKNMPLTEDLSRLREEGYALLRAGDALSKSQQSLNTTPGRRDRCGGGWLGRRW